MRDYPAAIATTSRGHIERLPSGSFRVRIYAGKDPVTGKERVLKETCPDEAEAAAALARLLKQADGHQAPSRNVLFGQVLDKYLEVTDLAESTLATHRSYINRIIRPVLGEVKGTPDRRGHARRAQRPPEAMLADLRAASEDRTPC